MAAKLLTFACIRNTDNSPSRSPRPRYPSMPKYPRGMSLEEGTGWIEGTLTATKAVFAVVGMTCAACAGCVEKAIKRLPGIEEAVVDVMNDRALVVFYRSFVEIPSTVTRSETLAAAAILLRSAATCHHQVQSSSSRPSLPLLHSIVRADAAVLRPVAAQALKHLPQPSPLLPVSMTAAPAPPSP
ncbi:putative copper-transporting ATPase HMA5 [Drosera capensis]